ncbi:uncharacterized protein N0V89_008703 [Didymosphaeria variabile]|uniref:Beta-lactamase-related domain-containing protein n=1 Tax=Didymosphaeria variabile TaxID=1932322 RepID=A0A9W8XH91_9PLEO|nr:uncharacterized protein N0V89_008703 [Didymosphaeria variabile]KAJ4350082.1 hypothetical protein N0V89_008703 [Didymosphaeria variabile]
MALAAVGGINDGEVEKEDFLAAYGTFELDPSSQAFTTKTPMWFASMTKFVTSVAVLQCIDRGLFGLESSDDVDRLLPEWSQPQILAGFEDGQPELQNAKEKITAGRLISHTSGLAYDFHPGLLLKWRQSRGEGPRAMRGTIPDVFTTPLLFEPGTGWDYGPGHDVAGLMVARANNCTLEEYMRENIFDVLGMDDTTFEPRAHHDVAARLPPMVGRPLPDEPLSDEIASLNSTRNLMLDHKDQYGSGGLFSTAEDYLKLLKSILRNDGQILKPETVDTLFVSTMSPSSDAALNITLANPAMAAAMIPGEPIVGSPGAGEWTHGLLGLIGLISKEGGLQAGWTQWGGAPNLKWWIDRKGNSCGIFATQLSPPGEKRHQPMTHLFQQEMAKRYRRP